MKKLESICLSWICFTLVTFVSPLDAQEGDDVAKLHGTCEQEIVLASEPLKELTSRYLEQLAKLKEKVQKDGDLEKALKIQSEIKNYAESEERDFGEIPELQRLRKIYDQHSVRLRGEIRKHQIGIMRQFAQKFDNLKQALTKKGDLEAATQAEDHRKKLIKQIQRTERLGGSASSTSDSLDLLWLLRTKGDFEVVKECNADRKGDLWVLTSPHKSMSYIESDESFQPPFAARVRAATDSVEIRMFYAGRQLVIFNWSSNPQQLRLHRPANGRPLGIQGTGYLEKNRFYDLEIQVTAENIRVLADGVVRGELPGDFKDLEGPFGIGPAFDSTISIESWEVQMLKPEDAN